MEYLLDPQPGPLSSQNLAVHLAILGLLGLSLAGSLVVRPRLYLVTFVSLLTLALILARILEVPFLSMRLLLFTALAAWVAVWLGIIWGEAKSRGWMEHLLRLFTFSWDALPPPLPIPIQTISLILHIAGMVLLAHYMGWSYLLGLILLVVLYSPLLIDGLAMRPRVAYLETLAPLYLVYGVVAARWIIGNIVTVPLYDPFAFPNALNAALSVEGWLIAAVAYSLLAQGYVVLWRHRAQGRLLALAGGGLLVFTLLWASAEYFGHRTRGVTGSDPYAYAQMAVDLVERGTPLHHFPLFPKMNTLGISWWPIVHVGYRLPIDGVGNAPTVWPVGGAIPLAVGYGLLGEEGLYLTTPLVGLLSVVAVFFLVYVVGENWGRGERIWAGAWAAFLLATSYEQIDRLLVPMADATAQLFTTLTVLFALVAAHKGQRSYTVLAGLAWGLAYLVRHTQLVLGISMALAVMLFRPEVKRRLELITLMGVTAFTVALPDLFYHQKYFGGFLVPESEELIHFSLINIATTLPLMLHRLFEGNEFGYLLPFMLWGGWRIYQDKRALFWILAAWILAVFFIHLPYRFLRLRDLLSLYPPMFVFVAYGVADIFRWAMAKKGTLIGALTVFLILLLPALRVRILLPRPSSTHTSTFGYMTLTQRQAFNEIAQLVPEEGIVGTSLNGGPIDLYSGRETFRPEVWSREEFDRFLETMVALGHPVYILDDGDSLASIMDYARRTYDLVEVADLEAPLFGDHASGILYRVQFDDGRLLTSMGVEG